MDISLASTEELKAELERRKVLLRVPLKCTCESINCRICYSRNANRRHYAKKALAKKIASGKPIDWSKRPRREFFEPAPI